MHQQPKASSSGCMHSKKSRKSELLQLYRQCACGWNKWPQKWAISTQHVSYTVLSLISKKITRIRIGLKSNVPPKKRSSLIVKIGLFTFSTENARQQVVAFSGSHRDRCRSHVKACSSVSAEEQVLSEEGEAGGHSEADFSNTEALRLIYVPIGLFQLGYDTRENLNLFNQLFPRFAKEKSLRICSSGAVPED